MSDFILDYDVLEDIAKYSDSLGRRAGEYGESLERKIIGAIDGVTGPSSGYLLNASDCVRDKINALNIKSKEFYQFSAQIKKLLEVAEQMDQEVADAIMAQREYFLDHHESLRIEDWKAKLQGLLVELKNSIPLLEVIADVLEGLDTIFESLKDSIKHWYECEGGKYIIDVVKSVGGVALAVGFLALAIGALALPTAGIFAICGVIGAGIAVVNSVTNVATSFRAADAALDGDPAWARIYGKQDKLSDVLRQTNFGNGTFNQLSNFSAGAIDATEVICDVVGVAEMGKSVVKLFQGDAFKLLKNKGGISYSDLKNGVKNGIVDLKSTIKQSYKDLKYGIKGNVNKNSLLGDKINTVSTNSGDVIKGGIENSRNINGLRTSKYYNLTDEDIIKIKKEINAIGADETVFRFNIGNQTGYVDGKKVINVKGDILPDLRSTHPRDLMSERAVLAHEYYGHMAYDGTDLLPGSWNDEFRASYMAAKNAPNLTDMDKYYLVQDAVTRAQEAGVTIKLNDFMKGILYGY